MRTIVIRGKVKRGAGRGKTLGFPTANITLHRDIPDGIYVSEVMFDEKVYRAVTFVGAAGTFGESEKKLEAYILHRDLDLYGSWITVRLLKKLRDNKTFSSKGELVEQMKKDVSAALAFFRKSD